MNTLEDQAAGLRRLFRRAPPTVVALFAVGRDQALMAVEACYGMARNHNSLLLLDETVGEGSLDSVLDLPSSQDLLSVLSEGVDAEDLIQPLPGLLGRVPVAAAANALPLLDCIRRQRVIAAIRNLHRRAGVVVVNANLRSGDQPSAFVFASRRRLVVAEASHSGATEAYATIKQLSDAGSDCVQVAVARARDRHDARAFFASLEALVRTHVGLPLAWLGEIEHDDIAQGLVSAAYSSPREHEAAFFRRLAALRL